MHRTTNIISLSAIHGFGDNNKSISLKTPSAEAALTSYAKTVAQKIVEAHIELCKIGPEPDKSVRR